jgi:hypothetical protein
MAYYQKALEEGLDITVAIVLTITVVLTVAVVLTG